MPTPCTVTGTLNQLTGGLIGQGKILFQLTNIGTGNPIGVTGTAIIPQLTYSIVTAQNGTFSISLWGNDNINPSNTHYSVTFFDALGNSMGPVLYNIIGASFNLNTAIAANVTSPPVFVPSAIVSAPLVPQAITGQPLTLTNAPFTLNNSPLVSDQINNVLCVGGAITRWGAGDIGAQLNAAYAALPATGGTIYLLPQANGSCYNYSTPIVFATAGKYLILNGLAPGTSNNANPGGACLNYTPTTATDAMSIDWTPLAGGGIKSGSGINYITLVNNGCFTIGGCGSSANGIRISKTNGGVENGLFNGVTVQGFGTGILDNNAATVAYGMTWNNLSVVYNTTGCNFIGYESLMMNGFYAQSNATGFSMASGEVTFYGGGIESNTVNNFIYTGASGLARANFYGVHFENLPNLTQHYISGPINVTISGGTMLDDFTAGALGDWMISVGGNHVRIDGLVVSSTRTAGITSILNVPGPGATRGLVSFMVNSPLAFTNRVNGGNAKAISDFSTQPNSANPYLWNVEGPLAIGGTTGLLNTPVTITAPATGASAFTNTLQGANDTFVYRGTTDTLTNKTLTSPALTTPAIGTSAFAALGAVPAAGIIKYCTDCTTAATCAGAGTGHMAVSNGTNWTCQ